MDLLDCFVLCWFLLRWSQIGTITKSLLFLSAWIYLYHVVQQQPNHEAEWSHKSNQTKWATHAWTQLTICTAQMKLFSPTVQGQEAIRRNIGLGDLRKQNLMMWRNAHNLLVLTHKQEIKLTLPMKVNYQPQIMNKTDRCWPEMLPKLTLS